MNINSSLTRELREKRYRDAYVDSQIRIGLPFQIRALRKSRDKMTQAALSKKAEMSQPRISEIESPGERNLNIDTLLRLASAFDVALEVRFVPFSALVDRSESFDPEKFNVPSFDDEMEALEKPEPLAAAFDDSGLFYRRITPTRTPAVTMSEKDEVPSPRVTQISSHKHFTQNQLRGRVPESINCPSTGTFAEVGR